jgi:hypothetical protein
MTQDSHLRDFTCPQPKRRCRWFGHSWGNWFNGRWIRPSWCAGGAEDGLTCKWCGIEFWRGGGVSR